MRLRILIVFGMVVSAACSESMLRGNIHRSVEREWEPAARKCALKDAVNPLGQGTIVYCQTDGGEVGPAWIHTEGVAYTIDGAARSLTPRLKSVREIDPGLLQRMGLEPARVEEQVRDIVSAQPKRSS